MRYRWHLKAAPGMHLETHGCSSEGDMGARELGLTSTQVPVERMGCPSEVICGERTHKVLD